MALKLEVVVTWDHECTKWHWIVHFKVVSFMLCEFLPQLKETYSQMLEIRMWNSFIQGWWPLNEWWKKSFLRKSAPEYSLEGLTLKLKLQYFGHLMPRTNSLEKTPIRLKAGGEGMTDDEMAAWHHWFDGLEFEQAPWVGDGQGSLACCSPWGLKESDTTEWLDNDKKGGRELLFCLRHLSRMMVDSWPNRSQS